MDRPVSFASLSQVCYLLSRAFAHRSRANLAPVVAYPFATVIMAVTFVESYFNEQIAIAEHQGLLSNERAEVLRMANPEEKLDGLLTELTKGKARHVFDPREPTEFASPAKRPSVTNERSRGSGAARVTKRPCRNGLLVGNGRRASVEFRDVDGEGLVMGPGPVLKDAERNLLAQQDRPVG